MSERLPTYKQIEREISQKIRALYDAKLNFKPQITCKLFSRYMAVVTEEAMTPLEQSLLVRGKKELILRVQKEISQILQPELIGLVEEIVGVKVVAILTNTTLISNKSGILVILSESPQVRHSKSLPKFTIERSS